MKKIQNLSVTGELAKQIETALRYDLTTIGGLTAIGNVRKVGGGYLVTYQAGNLNRCAFFKREANGRMRLKWSMICD